MPVIDDDGKVVLATDEHPRPQTTTEELAALKPSFAQIADMAPGGDGVTFRQLINRRYPDLKIEHFHHAGNSSGVVDGAAALLRRNLLIYGLGGIVVPFIGIKAIDLLITGIGLA